ncbi:hypothetical protein [Modestobacter sp. NPDC049651]|uniref:hypothetical protein n=1 Tax=unclassified Modestobacter TaxID=2643866 RepID=UPI0033DBBC71
MNQPHPPLPDYRPERTPEDPAEPRTQSILLPPAGSEEAAAPEPTAAEPAAAEPDEGAVDAPAPDAPEAPEPEHAPAEPAGATSADRTDFRPEVGPGPAFSPGAGAPPPLPGPRTGPQPDWSPPGWEQASAEPGATPEPTEQPPAEQPTADAGPDAAQDRLLPGTQVTTPVDFVPGFGGPGEPATGSTAAGAAVPPKPSPLPPPRGGAPWPSPGPATRPGPQVTPQGAAPSPSPAPRHPSTETSVLSAPAARRTRDVAALAALALAVVGLALTELGLLLDFDSESLWSALPTWSAFATVAALLGLVPALLRVLHRDPLGEHTSWRAGAVGAAALVGFWVLIALPLVASDRGFLLTLGTAATAAAVWVTPGRPARS